VRSVNERKNKVINLADNLNIVIDDINKIEGDSIQQLKHVMTFEGMIHGTGHPDIHPGKGAPNGATFLSEGIFYPYLIGNDIGCGVALYHTSMPRRKFKIQKVERKLVGMEGPDPDYDAYMCAIYGLGDDPKFKNSLGTIGHGNHFAEFQEIDKIHNQEIFDEAKLSKDRVYLMVHSGSRGLGESILQEHIMKHNSRGLKFPSEDADNYLKQHDYAVKWSNCNRAMIAKRFMRKLGYTSVDGVPKEYDWPKCISHKVHNYLDPAAFYTEENPELRRFVHRKGANKIDVRKEELIALPGSRGSLSYIVKPTKQGRGFDFHAGEPGFNHGKWLWSIAHGAGRKWKRSECKARLSKRYSVDNLKKTKLGSTVICEDKDLLYEEAPEAYKNIDSVVKTLVDHDIVEVVATLKPLLTYKKRKMKY